MAAARGAAGKGAAGRARRSSRLAAGGGREAPPSSLAAERERLALGVRDTCRKAAMAAWEEARSAGLCADGAWEAAVGSLSRLTAAELLASGAARDEGEPD